MVNDTRRFPSFKSCVSLYFLMKVAEADLSTYFWKTYLRFQQSHLLWELQAKILSKYVTKKKTGIISTTQFISQNRDIYKNKLTKNGMV